MIDRVIARLRNTTMTSKSVDHEWHDPCVVTQELVDDAHAEMKRTTRRWLTMWAIDIVMSITFIAALTFLIVRYTQGLPMWLMIAVMALWITGNITSTQYGCWAVRVKDMWRYYECVHAHKGDVITIRRDDE